MSLALLEYMFLIWMWEAFGASHIPFGAFIVCLFKCKKKVQSLESTRCNKSTIPIAMLLF